MRAEHVVTALATLSLAVLAFEAVYNALAAVY
jgi:hypothetical protein